MINVVLFCDSHSMHLAQLYTGFGELQRKGKIRCEWIISRGISSTPYVKPYLRVLLNNRWQLMYDQSDDYQISQDVNFSEIDVLFKRNFNPVYVKAHFYGQKILPLGLNYFVVSHNDHRLQRIILAKNDIYKWKNLLKQWRWSSFLFPIRSPLSDAEIAAFEDIPSPFQEPRVLFIAQLWRPERVKDEEHALDRYQINEMRVGLVRALRSSFGDRYVGGLIPNDYAVKHYPDCLIPDVKMTSKRNFLRLVKDVPICVTSNGLLGSIGYKFRRVYCGCTCCCF